MRGDKARAARAKAELNMTAEAFATMRENALELIAASRPEESFLRENLYRTVQVLDTLKTHLQAIVDGGKVEAFADAIREQSKPRAAS